MHLFNAPRLAALILKTLGIHLLLLASFGASAQTGPQPALTILPLQAGMHVIQAEVAVTPQQRQMGLMLREKMATNHGMLFVFEQAGMQCFWMKNTLLPLSIAFVTDDGKVVNITDMEPHSEQSKCSAKPVRFALEMNKGWFAKRGIKAGSAISGEPFKAGAKSK